MKLKFEKLKVGKSKLVWVEIWGSISNTWDSTKQNSN